MTKYLTFAESLCQASPEFLVLLVFCVRSICVQEPLTETLVSSHSCLSGVEFKSVNAKGEIITGLDVFSYKKTYNF